MAKHRSLDERLADAQRQKDQAAARVRELEIRQRREAARLRQRGEKVAASLVAGHAKATPELARMLWELAGHAKLKPAEVDALAALLGGPPAPEAAGSDGSKAA